MSEVKKSLSDEIVPLLSPYIDNSSGRWVFRGHSSKAYSLTPSVGPTSRQHPSKYTKSLFNLFQREAREYVDHLPSEWEWLALATGDILAQERPNVLLLAVEPGCAQGRLLFPVGLFG